jgi:hypothetical protein
MHTDDDPNWEALREEGEWEEKKRELFARAKEIRPFHKMKPLEIRALDPGTRLIVTLFDDDENPLACGPIEFVILDPASSKVMVKDRRNFTQFAEGTLLGCEHVGCPDKRAFQEGKLAMSWWINYEVNGKKYDRESTWATIQGVELILPSGTKYNLWKD